MIKRFFSYISVNPLLAIFCFAFFLFGGFLIWRIGCFFFWDPMDVTIAQACGETQCYQSVLLLTGEVKSDSAWVTKRRITQKISSHPEIDTICIASNGGVVSEAMDIADSIYDRGFNTCLASSYVLASDSQKRVDGLCQSACVWMVMAGKQRISFDDKLKLGFHGARSHQGGKPAPQDLVFFKDRIDAYKGHGESAAQDAEKLKRLSIWAFKQGFEPKTTDCTAHEVRQNYPYFTRTQEQSDAPAISCGLPPPEEVIENLPPHNLNVCWIKF